MAAMNFEHWGTYQRAAIDGGFALFGTLTTQVEKMTRLQLEAGSEAASEALAAVQALVEVKDAAGFGDWQATYGQPNLDRAVEVARKQYELMVESRDLLLEAFKEASADMSSQVQTDIDRLAEQAPEGFGALFDAIRSGLAAQTAALESVSRVGDQIKGIAEANVVAMNKIVKPATKPVAASKRKAA